MRETQLGSRLVGAAGAVAAGLGGTQAASAEVVAQALNLAVPPNYAVDLDGDTVKEFDLIDLGDPGGSEQIIKVYNFTNGVGVVLDESGTFAANLAPGTLIGPASVFSGPADDTVTPAVSGLPPDDALNGFDGVGPAGRFQVEDPAGFIGVQFLIAGQTHYGYVGFEGVELDGANEGTEGRVFGLGYESTPNTAIAAGAGLPAGPTADFDFDGDVDGNDYLVLQRGLGTEYDADDFTAFRNEFGTGGLPATVGVGAAPEPTSLALLAAGASGVAVYRRRRST